MLDSCWEENKNETLGQFLSEMNPYMWATETSADPAWYEEGHPAIFVSLINSSRAGEYSSHPLNLLLFATSAGDLLIAVPYGIAIIRLI